MNCNRLYSQNKLIQKGNGLGLTFYNSPFLKLLLVYFLGTLSVFAENSKNNELVNNKHAYYLKKTLHDTRYHMRMSTINQACKIMSQFQTECLSCFNSYKANKLEQSDKEKDFNELCAFNTQNVPLYQADETHYTYLLDQNELKRTLNLSENSKVLIEGDPYCNINMSVINDSTLGMEFNFESSLLPIKNKNNHRMVYDMSIQAKKIKIANLVLDSRFCSVELGLTAAKTPYHVQGRRTIVNNY